MAKIVLAKILKKKGLSKYRFAQLLGQPAYTVYPYFSKDFNPTLRTLEKIARALKVAIHELIEE